ncbi:MAG: hypothetical protein A2700_02010 [Candidatus Blackburnbacteria bacterium RIFCSPHIGHO2_01_FULL_44_64]|uniref:ComEC/Rec2-related protein domain-containing protein n=1 Tax=Candidatus Blackburnbacteria bacterium RIFCSPHIGHO2_02_FULL_44_20 TaxID=1797516 RepID=A0A1G1V9U6_9BACT|nr:MAG: hypothetical protein A2700_02010 [Candidatus Blackburnbacteria bacterium RIFCSPHIGHO2_01_FULL_44_64]OGY10480.1 MAG: hypothetical protein A3E16_04285 [Candidatus Blackburnbacteria bacterium RIFCSPHIGHO2_12_FULL_44_25]OGY12238.1 MAG: hypothetical protein A3D26_02195 [Candidatus Blackburnbacteria bacterium RIFCSPHIGHO2_02_FULL_44_20]OGY15113.1 MAG: hypothetical protein A3A62_00210 [Candidatus Blackburnbacteria bacterium RIFCSPLOWO2_01_FULL_44_43]OGY15231.1 MAG: hypothetical protein A3H88_0
MRRGFVSLCVICFLVGIFLIRYYTFSYTFKPIDTVKVEGRISSDPLVFGNRQRIEVGQFRAYIPRYPEYFYGDLVLLEGHLAQKNNWWEFKRVNRIERVEEAGKGLLLGLRQRVVEIYKELLPEPHSALLSGVVLGTKSSLDSRFFDALRNTSTLHIVVASGTNVSFLGGGILGFLAPWMGRKKALIFALLAIWVYVLLSGIQPPLVRAAVMGTIAFLAQSLGREFSAIRALVFSAVILLLIYPFWLFDLGFQLSFLATLGVIGFGGWIGGKLGGLRKFPAIRESLATSLGAQIAVAPLLFFNFGQISFIGPLVNMLVLPTVPIIMVLGFVLGGLGLLGKLGEQVAQLFAWAVWLPLEYFVRIVTLFGN